MPLTGLSGTNLKNASNHNLRVMLQAIRLKGPLSRAELADHTGLTPQAVAYITKKLIADGLVMDTGRRQGRRGQPATEIAINPDGGYSIGVNIDRDHMTVILLDISGKVRGRAHIEKNFMLPEETFKWIEQAFLRILKENDLTPDDLTGVGLAIPYKLGYLRLAITPPEFSVWRDYPSRQRLEKITGLPVFEENDATATAIGESQYGHGIECRNFFYLFLAYGLGGGLILNGNYVSGGSGHGGEIGFAPIPGSGRVGNRPENLQDRVSLATLYAHLLKEGISVSDPESLEHLYDTAPDEIDKWLDGAAKDLLQPLIVIICAVNPGAILIGGRLPSRLIDKLNMFLQKRIEEFSDHLPDVPNFSRAICADDAAALGAAIVPFTRSLFPVQDVLLKKAD